MAGPKVLVVEDEPFICELISDALGDEGVDVVCAGSFNDAVDALANHGTGIVLLLTDINLGGVRDGFDVAAEARRVNPEMFVLYTSGHAEAEVVSRGVPGAMVVPKPYSPTELAGRIGALARVAGTH